MQPTRKQVSEALRYLRVPSPAPDEMVSLVEDAFDRLSKFIKPRTIYRRFPLTVRGDIVEIGDGSVSCPSKNLARLFRNCRTCVAMAVTLGPAVDRQTQLLSRSEVAAAVAFDACASVWADALCDNIEAELEEQLVDQEYLTLRFSPGYGDVPMSLTGDLLQILDAPRRIGLTLTRKGMMIPVKSVTALIGISDRPEKRQRSCDDCAFAACAYRRKGGSCNDTSC